MDLDIYGLEEISSTTTGEVYLNLPENDRIRRWKPLQVNEIDSTSEPERRISEMTDDSDDTIELFLHAVRGIDAEIENEQRNEEAENEGEDEEERLQQALRQANERINLLVHDEVENEEEESEEEQNGQIIPIDDDALDFDLF